MSSDILAHIKCADSVQAKQSVALALITFTNITHVLKMLSMRKNIICSNKSSTNIVCLRKELEGICRFQIEATLTENNFLPVGADDFP